MSVLREDTYVRANTSSGLGTPSDGGSAWAAVTGTYGISSNHRYETTGTSNSIAYLACGAADVLVEDTLVTLNYDTGISARVTSNNALVFVYCTAGDIGLQEVVAGSFNFINSYGAPASPGDVIGLQVNGSAAAVFKNGVQIFTGTLTTQLTAQNHGVWSWADTLSAWGHFKVSSLGGGGTTISATPGNAVADGVAAAVRRTIGAAPGNAVADGVTAAVVRTIAATPGNAVADGVTAALVRGTIAATPGNAVADGVTAAVRRTIPAAPGNAAAAGVNAAVNVTVGAAPGNAVADGVTAAVRRTIAATPGNAVANGVTATVTNGVDVTISATPGNAVADGVTAAVRRTVAAAPGNAVADGVTATITAGGATIISCTPGNAVANGVTAVVLRTIAAAPGNAVADGVTAGVVRGIAAAPGNAVADGVTAGVVRRIAAAPGNAVADGVTAAVVRGIPAVVGNAVANGMAATVINNGNIKVTCVPGNAVANGWTATVSNLDSAGGAAYMAFTLDQFNALQATMASGVLTVEIDGVRTTYQSLADMRKMRDLMLAELTAAGMISENPNNARRSFSVFSRS